MNDSTVKLNSLKQENFERISSLNLSAFASLLINEFAVDLPILDHRFGSFVSISKTNFVSMVKYLVQKATKLKVIKLDVLKMKKK